MMRGRRTSVTTVAAIGSMCAGSSPIPSRAARMERTSDTETARNPMVPETAIPRRRMATSTARIEKVVLACPLWLI